MLYWNLWQSPRCVQLATSVPAPVWSCWRLPGQPRSTSRPSRPRRCRADVSSSSCTARRPVAARVYRRTRAWLTGRRGVAVTAACWWPDVSTRPAADGVARGWWSPPRCRSAPGRSNVSPSVWAATPSSVNGELCVVEAGQEGDVDVDQTNWRPTSKEQRVAGGEMTWAAHDYSSVLSTQLHDQGREGYSETETTDDNGISVNCCSCDDVMYSVVFLHDHAIRSVDTITYNSVNRGQTMQYRRGAKSSAKWPALSYDHIHISFCYRKKHQKPKQSCAMKQ